MNYAKCVQEWKDPAWIKIRWILNMQNSSIQIYKVNEKDLKYEYCWEAEDFQVKVLLENNYIKTDICPIIISFCVNTEIFWIEYVIWQLSLSLNSYHCQREKGNNRESTQLLKLWRDFLHSFTNFFCIQCCFVSSAEKI